MKQRLQLLFVLAVAGVLFSGYLSAQKFFVHVCALGDTCANFLGYPTCYYGFGMFVIIFLAALLALVSKKYVRTGLQTMLAVSMLGIAFAGYFTAIEVPPIFTGMKHYTLFLPTCAYGLVVYIAVLINARAALKAKAH